MRDIQEIALFEILVPKYSNIGKKFSIEHHHRWDDRVREIAHGLTIMRSTKGIWESDSGKIFEERMIPVRIACNFIQILDIADFTIDHYEQEAIMYYLVSSYVIIRKKQ